MEELIFVGMDIPREVKKLLSQYDATKGMEKNELVAYNIGIDNALSALGALLSDLDEVYVHVNGLESPEECDIEDLTKA